MFLVCGEALWDLFEVPGEGGLAFDARIGGSPFNVAVGLARLGQPSALFTGVSRDSLGRRLVDALEEEGVHTGMLLRQANPTTLSVVCLGMHGEPEYQFYGQDAADRVIREAELPEVGPEVWGIHAGSYSLAVEPVGSALLALFAREKGQRLLAIDPNVRLNAEPDRGVWRSQLAGFLAYADVAKASVEDLALLYPGEKAEAVAEGWLESGVGLAVVTHGPEGAEAFWRGGRIKVPGIPVQVVDTVGAGDSFQASLIAGLADAGARTRPELDALDGGIIERIVGRSVSVSATVCARRGADLPRRADVSAGDAGEVA